MKMVLQDFCSRKLLKKIVSVTVAGLIFINLMQIGFNPMFSKIIGVQAEQGPSASGCPCKGPAPLTVGFKGSLTYSDDSFFWSFGDGVTDDADLNPSHIYTTQGVYTAVFTDLPSDGSQPKSSVVLINVTASNPWVSFVENTFSGINWTVQVSMQGNEHQAPVIATNSSTSQGIIFNIASLGEGTWNFIVFNVPGYACYTPTGTLKVYGGANQQVAFYPITNDTITFTENGLPSGSWQVGITSTDPWVVGTALKSSTSNTITFTWPDGTDIRYNINPVGGYVPTPNVNNLHLIGSVNIAINFSSLASYTLIIVPQYSGYFLQGLDYPPSCSYDIYLAHPPDYGVSATVTPNGNGASNPTVESTSDTCHYVVTLNPSSYPAGAVLSVSASYAPPTNTVTNSCSLNIIPMPSWFIPIFNWISNQNFNTEYFGWTTSGTSYDVTVDIPFDLSDAFKIPIPISALPASEGGGNYTLSPSVDLNFDFNSTGTLTMSVTCEAESPEIDLGPIQVQITPSITGSANCAVSGSNILWDTNAYVKVGLTVGGSYTPPTPLGFDVPGFGNVGVTLTVGVKASFTLDFVLGITQNNSAALVQGFDFIINSFNLDSEIKLTMDLSLEAGLGDYASVTGETSLTANIGLQPQLTDLISSATLTGSVSCTVQLLWWSYTYYLVNNAQLWPQSGGPMIGSELPPAWIPTPAYFNTSNYGKIVWNPTNGNGIAMANIYPFAKPCSCSIGNTTYLFYTNDNLSLPGGQGMCISGLQLQAGALSTLPMPALTGEVTFNPALLSLPNQTLLAVWDYIPQSVVAAAQQPSDISTVGVQYSCYDPGTGNWNQVATISDPSKIVISHSISYDSWGTHIMVLEGSSMPPSPLQIYTSPDPSQLPLGFGGSGQLREYNLDSNNPVVSLMNLNVANVTKILSFSYVDQYALLRLEDGSTELLNTTTGQPINLPMMDDLTITSVLPTNSAGTFGILYTDSNSSVFCVYNMSSNAALAGMSLSSIPSNIALTQEGVGYNLVVTDNSGITSYALIGHNVQTTLSYPIQNITWVGSILTNNGLLVYSTQNYGNSSNPQLNLVLTPVPDSPMFHHDASHTGYSVSTVPVTNQLLWHYATGGVVSSSPAIAGGIAYVGSSDGNIYALDATTGVPMWNYTTGGTVRSSPAVDDGMVFVSSDDGYTYDFNAQTGTLQWKSMTGGGQSSPAVANGVVYVGSSNDTVVALSETTGDILWTYTTSGIVNSSPAVSGGMVYVGSHDHNVYALNATTGACVWSYTTGGPVPSSPAVAGGIVYVGSDDWNVYALNAATGAYIWSVYVYGSVPCSPAVANGVVYVGSEDHRVYALNATTGSALWTYLTGAGIGFSSPTVASGIVFIGSEDDKLIALNATMGSLIWSYSTNGYLESTPAVADGNVYVGSNDGNIYAFGLFSVTLTYESSWMALNQPQTFISTVSGGAGTCYYQWYLDGSPASGATDPTYTFTLTSSGVHTVYVIVTDSAGIQTTSNVVNIYVPASEGVSKGGGGGTHPLTLWC